MNDKDHFEFEKLKLIKSVRQAVEQDLKRRYSWLGFALAIIVGSLITLTVDRVLKGAQISLAEAQAIQKMATTNLATVALRSDQLAKQFEQYQKEITNLNEIAGSIAGQLKEATGSNLKYSSELRDEISELSAVVQFLAAKHAPAKEKAIEQIGIRLKKSKADIMESKEVFQENMNQVQRRIQAQRPMLK